MEQQANFRKWGWWAIGGLVIIAVVAVIVVVAQPGPEPNEPANDGLGTTIDVVEEEVVDEEVVAVEEVVELVAVGDSEALPQSGPTDNLGWILAAGGVGYLVSLGLGRVWRRKI